MAGQFYAHYRCAVAVLHGQAIFDRAARELAEIVGAIRVRLGYDLRENVRLSYSGGVFGSGDIVLRPLRNHLSAYSARYSLTDPVFAPGVGAAICAARLSGQPLDRTALAKLPRLSG